MHLWWWLVVAVAAVHLPAATSTNGRDLKLPETIEQWNLVPGFAHIKRFWGRDDLVPAFQSMGDPLHAALLLAKLNAGRPITAVALGSSFVANQAGCFHTSLQQLYDRGVLPNPHICACARTQHSAHAPHAARACNL